MIVFGTAENEYEITFFENKWEEYKDLLKEGDTVIIYGTYKKSDFGFRFNGKAVYAIERTAYIVNTADYDKERLKGFESALGGDLYIIENDNSLKKTEIKYSDDILALPGIRKMPKL